MCFSGRRIPNENQSHPNLAFDSEGSEGRQQSEVPHFCCRESLWISLQIKCHGLREHIPNWIQCKSGNHPFIVTSVFQFPHPKREKSVVLACKIICSNLNPFKAYQVSNTSQMIELPSACGNLSLFVLENCDAFDIKNGTQLKEIILSMDKVSPAPRLSHGMLQLCIFKWKCFIGSNISWNQINLASLVLWISEGIFECWSSSIFIHQQHGPPLHSRRLRGSRLRWGWAFILEFQENSKQHSTLQSLWIDATTYTINASYHFLLPKSFLT